jgi:ketosteroid isomerase-like protein
MTVAHLPCVDGTRLVAEGRAVDREDRAMTEVAEFLGTVMPTLHDAEFALHDGDAGPRIAIWSHHDPVTVLGAVRSAVGWSEVEPAFEWLASRFSGCQSFEYEVIAAGTSGDLAYVVGTEHTIASVGSDPPLPYELRVTTIFRREDGEWKVVHRHADPMPGHAGAREQLARL